MKKLIYFSTILFIVLTSLPEESHAQVGRRNSRSVYRNSSRSVSRFSQRRRFKRSYKYFTFGGGIGVANYFGDLTPSKSPVSTDLGLTSPSVSAFVSQRLSPHFTLRGNLAWVRLRGDDFSNDPSESVDKWARYVRNLHFRNDIVELTTSIMADLLPTERGYLRRNYLNPYAHIGLSVWTNNPKAIAPDNCVGCESSQGEWIALQPLKTEGVSYSTVQIGIPMGLGVKYRIADNVDLSMEFTYNWIFTDYIDDVSKKNFTDPKSLSTDLAREMANRSGESTAVLAGDDRNLDNVLTLHGFDAKRVKDSYGNNQVVRGFQSIDPVTGKTTGNPRGNPSGRDYYTVTSVKLAYIIGNRSRGPRYR